MKILVINLLRLGDFLQIAPVLDGLAKRPARVDVLTFKQVQALQPLLSCVGKWWTLDRDELQAGLGQAEIPLLTSYDVLKESLAAISAEKYDLIINLTQTEFSGWVTGYLSAKEKLGLSFDTKGRPLFHSPWFRYLDQNAQVKSPHIFNYTDIFLQACGVKEKNWSLQPTPAGVAEVAALSLPRKPTLVCQVFTSDQKKNWGEGAWIEFLARFHQANPAWQSVLLGSPQESDRIDKILSKANVASTKAIVSLDGALALLKQSDLLVTGDTSIKHLANAAAIRVVELSLGSSDYLRTGIYKHDSLILQPRVACSPCPHSGSCTQPTHACAELLSPSLVAEAAQLLAQEDWESLRLQALAQADVTFMRTRHLETGFWFAADLALTQPLRSVDAILERCTQKFLLNQEFKRELVEFGTETVRLENEIQNLFSPSLREPLLTHLDFLERETHQQQENAAYTLGQFAKQFAGEAFDLSQIRVAHGQVEQQVRQAEIKVKLIRSLKLRLMEKT